MGTSDPTRIWSERKRSPLIKRFLPRTLFGRSLMIIVTPAILLQIVSIWVFFDTHWRVMTDRLAGAVAGEIAYIIERMDSNMSKDALDTRFGTMRRELDLLVSFTPAPDIKAPSDAGEILAEAIDIETRQRAQAAQDDGPAWSRLLEDTLAEAIRAKITAPFAVATLFEGSAKEIVIDIDLDDGKLRVIVPQRRLFSSNAYVFVLW
ncbi:MAG: hypothetical protein U9N14_06490, partial [Pseudomonadota bacterium]|nr:hypothetical protein [Pseudomonadota bacterium]